jgi:hypothetical protein
LVHTAIAATHTLICTIGKSDAGSLVGILLNIDRKCKLETIINEYNACQRNEKDF